MKKRISVIIIAVFVIISVTIAFLLIPRATKLDFDQDFIGKEDNPYQNGPWWGDNLIKIGVYNDFVYSYTMLYGNNHLQAQLFRKEINGDWEEGLKIDISRPPCLLIDPEGYVNIIGYLAFSEGDEYQGRLFHLKMDNPEAISGDYSFEFISPDWRNNLCPETYVTIYFGAGIGDDGTIVVVSTNSQNEPWSLGARIFDPSTETWTFEPITSNLTSRFCYQYVAITDSSFHIVAIEDQYDPALEGERQMYRFGMIKHYQRSRNSNDWKEDTLKNLNPLYSAKEILDMNLKIGDLLVDRNNKIHILYFYQENDNTHVYHLTKKEEDFYWNEETWTTYASWIRLWERKDGQLFYLYAEWEEDFKLIPMGSSKKYIISDLEKDINIDLWPYIASSRGGSEYGDIMNFVAYSGFQEVRTKGIGISVNTSVIEL